MVIRDPSRGPNFRSCRCDRALGHRSHNRPRPDHIESPDSPPIVAASLKDTCRTYQRRRAQSDPPQTPQFAARRCDRTIGPITRLWGSLWAQLSLREGGENRTRTDRTTRLASRSIIPCMDHLTIGPNGARAKLDLVPDDDRAKPDRPPPGRRLDQSEHPRELAPRPPPVRLPGAAVVPRTTRPSPPTWPSSTTPAGARAARSSPSPPSASAPAWSPTIRPEPPPNKARSPATCSALTTARGEPQAALPERARRVTRRA